ncbi:hypothetical protein C922_04351 [Plasmodium inui San Antonio 1]|uniref:Phospholipase/carboxylesterase/thioesterase domain-containing protein n=1 Tax=Plasmodium inui San Antonio 1 TaxID=1237626 RepID=W6ZWP5_9APIC|nr:hypothetical protein C922_04351 [Plasmodium inui San Antonio 1]EUD65222.1 hypothetical protein C922_04351 [Plasmodium inui San Antonio 1]
MEEPIKILYLHIYEDSKTKKIRKLLEGNYGKDNVISSKDKSRVVDIIILVVIYILCLCCIFLIFNLLFSTIKDIYLLILPCFFVTMSVFFIATTIIYEILYRRCLGKANKLFDTLKPNVIVGYQFGCILAMHLSGARVPMVLVSPVQENIFSSKIRKSINISDYPYIIFVHSTKDTKRNLTKTLELVESVNKQNCRVEIVEEGHNLELMTASDYKNWVDEVYLQGQEVGKNVAPSSTTVDESMFKSDE